MWTERWKSVLLFSLLMLAACIGRDVIGKGAEAVEPAEEVTLTVLYDNNPGDPGLRSAEALKGFWRPTLM